MNEHARFRVSTLGLLALVIASGVIAQGCGSSSGNGSPTGSSGASASSTGGAGSVGGSGSGIGGGIIDPAVFAPAEAGLRRLTLPQYRNSLSDLFGAAALPATELEPDSALSGFASIAAARLALSASLTEEFETAALEVAHKALSNPAGRAALLGCTPAGVTDSACTSQFFTKLGRRAWRRPLTPGEVSGLTNLVEPIQTALADYFAGLEYGVAALLQSPHFLYREEIGTPDASNPALAKLNDHELATRLSFFLWNTTPDDALLDAADASMLTTPDGFQAQVTRLLGSPRATDAVKNFFTEYFRLAELDGLTQLPSQYPQNTPTIGPAMREETASFLANIALGQGDYRALFDSRDTFVNAELAQLYGLPPPAGAGFVQVTLPESGMRAGLLGQASFLALNSHATGTSPTRRGKFIQEMLRCQQLPPPPPNVPPLPNDASTASQTMRQKLEIHRQVEPCKTCHALMDPMGLAFENFDAMGVLRTTEVGQPIDASGELDGQAFSGPRELAALLRQDPSVAPCAARNLYRYALGHVEGVQGNEEPAIDQIVKAFAGSQYQFTALMHAIVTSPAFGTVATPSQTLPVGPAGVGGSGAGGAAAAGGSGGAPATGGMGPASGGTGMVVANPTFAKDIAPIIASNCEPCHTTQAKAGFNWSYANLVTDSAITSALAGTCKYIDAAKKRVIPGDPDHSLLWIKLAIDQHQSSANGCGDHMPQAPSPHVLTTAELDTIRAWIVQGALP